MALAEKHAGHGEKAGESRLLAAEMLAIAKNDVKNIVCNQPMGGDGKEIIDLVKIIDPDVNVVAVDYDANSFSDETDELLRQMIKDSK